jgi:choline dehydrogenase-like flavoprotein
MYDVIIVGAGPAGLFAAYELITKNKKLKVLLLDQGKLAEDRVCTMNKFGTKCKNCKPCNILSGFGGAGTFSDGKLNYVAKLGKSDLYKYMNSDEAEKLMSWGFREFNNYEVLTAGQKIATLPVWFGQDNEVDLVVPQTVFRTMKKNKASKIKMTAEYDKPVKAPIKRGDKLGFVKIEIPGQSTTEVPLVAAKDIEPLGFFGRFVENLKYLLGGIR